MDIHGCTLSSCSMACSSASKWQERCRWGTNEESICKGLGSTSAANAELCESNSYGKLSFAFTEVMTLFAFTEVIW